MDITVIGRLGNKYYKGITTKEEICGEFSGEINLTEIILDNQNVLAVGDDGKLLSGNSCCDISILEITSATLELNQGVIKDGDGHLSLLAREMQ